MLKTCNLLSGKIRGARNCVIAAKTGLKHHRHMHERTIGGGRHPRSAHHRLSQTKVLEEGNNNMCRKIEMFFLLWLCFNISDPSYFPRFHYSCKKLSDGDQVGGGSIREWGAKEAQRCDDGDPDLELCELPEIIDSVVPLNRSTIEETISRGRWLVGLLVLQSSSSFILDSYQELIKQHLVVTLFLTMLG